MKFNRKIIFKNGTIANALEVNVELDNIVEGLNGKIDKENIRDKGITKEKLDFVLGAQNFRGTFPTPDFSTVTDPKELDILYAYSTKSFYIYKEDTQSWVKNDKDILDKIDGLDRRITDAEQNIQSLQNHTHQVLQLEGWDTSNLKAGQHIEVGGDGRTLIFVKKPSGEGEVSSVIDDEVTSVNSTYSSYKIFNEFYRRVEGHVIPIIESTDFLPAMAEEGQLYYVIEKHELYIKLQDSGWAPYVDRTKLTQDLSDMSTLINKKLDTTTGGQVQGSIVITKDGEGLGFRDVDGKFTGLKKNSSDLIIELQGVPSVLLNSTQFQYKDKDVLTKGNTMSYAYTPHYSNTHCIVGNDSGTAPSSPSGWTKFYFNIKTFDPKNEFDVVVNDYFQPKESGRYQFIWTTTLSVKANVTTKFGLRVNGALRKVIAGATSSVNGVQVFNSTAIINLSTTDTVELVYTSGDVVNFNKPIEETCLEITRVP